MRGFAYDKKEFVQIFYKYKNFFVSCGLLMKKKTWVPIISFPQIPPHKITWNYPKKNRVNNIMVVEDNDLILFYQNIEHVIILVEKYIFEISLKIPLETIEKRSFVSVLFSYITFQYQLQFRQNRQKLPADI